MGGNALGLAALVFLALNPFVDLFTATLVFVLIGLTGGAYGLLMAHGRAFIPEHLTGRGVTLLNFFAIGGVGVMQFATGGVVSATFDAAEPQIAYAGLFWFYASMLGASLALYLFARDARPESCRAV